MLFVPYTNKLRCGIIFTLYFYMFQGAQYFKIKIIKVAVNKEERTVNIKAMRKAITGNTVMVKMNRSQFVGNTY